jgi:DNA repair protein RadA/Sms
MFLSERGVDVSGSAVVCSMEGTRPVLVEIQALVTDTSYATPQRSATGFDVRRLQMLLAVLEKREGLRLSSSDVFVNVAGGVRLEEPAVDMGVAVAIATSLRDRPVDRTSFFVGEIGLGGEIRSVNRLPLRLKEAQKLGFARAYIPAGNANGADGLSGLDIISVDSVSQLIDLIV